MRRIQTRRDAQTPQLSSKCTARGLVVNARDMRQLGAFVTLKILCSGHFVPVAPSCRTKCSAVPHGVPRQVKMC